MASLLRIPWIHRGWTLTTEGPTTTQEEPLFSLLISRRASTSLLHGERNPGVPVAPEEEAVTTLHSRGTPGVMPPFHKTRCPNALQIHLTPLR